MTPNEWALENGIKDPEAVQRITWGMQMFNGSIAEVTNIKKPRNPKEELIICVIPSQSTSAPLLNG